MFVFKFGGSILNSADNIRKVASIIKNFDDKLIIVVSAMGKTTNLLEDILFKYYKNSDTNQLLQNLYSFHADIIKQLFTSQKTIFEDFFNLFNSLKKELSKTHSINFDFDYGRIVVFGELFSSLIISKFLNSIGLKNKLVDIRQIIKTDSNYRQANVDIQTTEKNIKTNFNFKDTKIYITQGFIGSDKNNFSTTLGREGSDYTASLIASSLNAKIIIWKDVNGIYNCDPKIFDNAIKFKQLDYNEAIELGYFGAKVLHFKTIFPLKNKGLQLTVKSFLEPDNQGTTIGNFNFPSKPYVSSVILKDNQILISIDLKNQFVSEKTLMEIFKIFDKYSLKINLLQTTALKIFVVLDDNPIKINELLEALKQKFAIKIKKNLILMTIRHLTQQIENQIRKKIKFLLIQKTHNTAFYLFEQKYFELAKINF